MTAVIAPRKLIEVALPLDEINKASAKEKSVRHGHPSTLHLWWARRPLATARAVIFAQMVNDPSWKWDLEHPGQEPPGYMKGTWAKSRKRLFQLLTELVQWENTTNETVLNRAREEIRKSWRETCVVNNKHPQASELFNPDQLPGFHDPFAGGGALPLEAQRLGLASSASDLNPVAVLINKAMVEIPPRVAGRPPVNRATRDEKGLITKTWPGTQGLVEDIRYYGQWMHDQAQKRIGHLYPNIKITPELVAVRPDLKPLLGQSLKIMAWLWARTVKSPNPAFSHVDVPLASTFMLSTKPGKETYVEPVIAGDSYRFTVKIGSPKTSKRAKNGTKTARGATFECLLSSVPITSEYIKAEGKAGRLGARLMAIVAEGARGRVYLDPTPTQETAAHQMKPEWSPEQSLPDDSRNFWTVQYGLKTYGDLFTDRQLVALTTFSNLIIEAAEQIRTDATAAGLPNDPAPLRTGGAGAKAYSEAVGLYLAFALSRSVDRGSAVCSWDSSPKMEALRNTFGRQAIPMTWDYAEGNPFSDSSGNWLGNIEWVAKAVERFPANTTGTAVQANASTQSISADKVVSTDPPYYDNIGYADLSDFFFVWLRRSLRDLFPDILATLAVPKSEELVASPYRHGGAEKAEHFFLGGMTVAMQRLAAQAHPAFPTTIYYAFKQSESAADDKTSSTGWETFLAAVIRAGFSIDGTWPMRTEMANRMVGSGTNALASSIVLVCRHRDEKTGEISRRTFQRKLEEVLPQALADMTTGANGWGSPVAPVDMSQAIIGPGMAVFSKYSAVLEADGTPMSVRTALQLINRFLADDDFDADTRFCLKWFEQFGWKEGAFGDADVVARSYGTSVSGIEGSGVVESACGKVRLFRPSEYPTDWDPATDARLPAWEAMHHLVRSLQAGGEASASAILGSVASKSGTIRQLAYRLYTLCERKGWADDARSYNQLMTSWNAIELAASKEAVASKDEAEQIPLSF